MKKKELSKKRILKLITLSVFILGLISVSAWYIFDKRLHNKAAEGTINWVSHGPGSFGYMTSVVSDPNNADIAYGASDVSGIFKTTDGGESWQFANRGTDYDTSMNGYYVAGLKIDPANNNTIYAYTKRGVYVSTNAAGTWAKMVNSPPVLEFGPPDDEMPSGSLSGTSLLALGNKKKDQPDQTVLYTLVLDGTQTITGTTDVDIKGGVYRNVNGSADWINITKDTTTGPIDDGTMEHKYYSIAVDPQNYDHIFVGTSKGLYETDDASVPDVVWRSWNSEGNPWESDPNANAHTRDKGILLPNYDIRFIGFNKTNSNIVYAVNRHGELFRSDRASAKGYNFERIEPISTNLFECTTMEQYVGCQGVATVQAAYVDTNPNDATEDTIYMAYRDGSYWGGRATILSYNAKTKVWKTLDRIENTDAINHKNIYAPSDWSVSDWTTANTLGWKSYLDVNQAAGTYNNRKIYITNGIGIGVGTTDAQETLGWRWDIKPHNLENYMPQDAQFDPNDPNILYVLSLDQGFVKSTDGGKTFKRKSDGMYYTTVPDKDLCLNGKGPNCFRGHAMRLVVIPNADKTKPSTLLMLGYPWHITDGTGLNGFRLFESTDGGENWTHLPNLPGDIKTSGLYDPKFFYNQEDELLFLTTLDNNKIYYSENRGGSWAQVPTEELTTTNIKPLDANPSVRNGITYVAQNNTLTAGIYNGDGGLRQIYWDENSHSWSPSWEKIPASNITNFDGNTRDNLKIINKDFQVVSLDSFDNGDLIGTVRNWYYPIGLEGDSMQRVNGSESSWSSCGVIKSTDGGKNWTLISRQNNSDCEINIKKSDPDVFYLTSTYYNDNAIMKTTDGGSTFQSESIDLPVKRVKKIVIHPYDSSKVLQLNYTGGLFWSYTPNEIQAPATINYTLSLQGAVNNSTSGVSLKIYNVGGTTPVFEKADLNTDGTGKNIFLLSDFDPGNYDVEIKVPGYLAKILRGQQVSDGASLQFLDLRGGDLNNDNGINAGDYTYFSGKWLTTDPVIDINRDGQVNGGDFNIMNNNWWAQGDKIGI